MKHLCAGAVVLGLLAGCTGQNTNMSTLQFSGAEAPFPAGYQIDAARAVAGQAIAPGTSLLVSSPQTTLGRTAVDPRRWYVCVRGLTTPASASGRKSLWGAADSWFDPQRSVGQYEMILIYGATGRPSIRTGYDSPLCRNAQFQPLTAPPPIT